MATDRTQPQTITLTLTPDEVRNLVAFGNRATMKGSEADLWVGLKMKVLKQADENYKSTDLEVVKN